MATEHLIHSTVGTELVRMLAEIGDRIFTAERAKGLAATLGISPGYIRQALHHLAKSGWIVRLRRGTYALSGAVPGSLPLHEFEIAMALVQPAAISHWSALNYHGLTEQTSRHVFVLTSARSVPRLRGKRKLADPGYPVGNTIYRFLRYRGSLGRRSQDQDHRPGADTSRRTDGTALLRRLLRSAPRLRNTRTEARPGTGHRLCAEARRCYFQAARLGSRTSRGEDVTAEGATGGPDQGIPHPRPHGSSARSLR